MEKDDNMKQAGAPKQPEGEPVENFQAEQLHGDVPAEGDLPDSLDAPVTKEDGRRDSSISGRLEMMLEDMAGEHSWELIEEQVLQSIDNVPRVAETALSSWLWWLIATTALGVVVMGWLRAAELAGWHKGAVQAMLPALGNSLLILSALGLIWVGRAGVKPVGEDAEFGAPSLRWLIIGSGWAAAMVGALVAFLPAVESGQVPAGMVPFIILSAISGLAASWALELRHQEGVFAIASDSMLRRVSIAAGVLLIAAGSILQIYFLVLHH